MTERRLAAALLAFAALTGCAGESRGSPKAPAKQVSVRAGIDAAMWGRLLQKYVEERGLVDYGAWKASAADRESLRGFLRELAAPGEPPARGNELAASLINAYNALTIEWILENYPTESIRSLDHSFDAERHWIGGRKVSLDQIEHETLRPQFGFRVHATVVCAARSCPPLARQEYRPGELDPELDAAMRRWFAREDLNTFLPAENRAEISMIFRWYREDFQKAPGGLRAVLAAYAPQPFRNFLQEASYKIDYKPYDWGLNDQGPHGRDYGGVRELLDKLRSK